MINNNLIYANTNQGILVQAGGGAGTQIVNDTIYEPLGDGIDLQQHSTNVQLRNDIIWVQAGYDVNVASDSQAGFASDYNVLYTSGSGQVGLWQQIPAPTMQLWRNADFTDADSLFANPLFVNVGANPGYASSSSDGRGDDFHEQSQQGSYPRRRARAGRQRRDGAADAADADVDHRRQRIARHRPRRRQRQLCQRAGPQRRLHQHRRLRQFGPGLAQSDAVPVRDQADGGGEVWPEQQTFNITWRYALMPVNGVTPPAGTVDINLLQTNGNARRPSSSTSPAPSPTTGSLPGRCPTRSRPAPTILCR